MPATWLAADPHKCSLPLLDPDGQIVYFDVQSAEPGAFTVPGVIDLESYEPGSIAESSWIYFKGDPQAGPQPGHPFDMPFDNANTKFAVDLVNADDTSAVIRHVMPPTNSSLFWEGGAPFGRSGNYTMSIPLLDRSCKYYAVASMIYRWAVPEDLDNTAVYRLKLITDEPATTHLSGKLRISSEGDARSSLVDLDGGVLISGLSSSSSDGIMMYASMGFVVVLLLFLARFSGISRTSRRISLE